LLIHNGAAIHERSALAVALRLLAVFAKQSTEIVLINKLVVSRPR